MEELFPTQLYFNAVAVGSFISANKKISILEIGGWKGELADIILKKFDNINIWTNLEICSNAVEKSVCKDIRYNPIVITRNVWDYDHVGYDICVMSHMIEHIKARELKELFRRLSSINKIYIHAPIEDTNASRFRGGHILEIGWNKIRRLLKDYDVRNYSNTIKFYEKIK